MPQPGNPQALNRYAYALNNPLCYTDPSGHWVETAWDILNIAWDIYEVYRDPHSWENWVALAVDVGAAVLPVVPAGAGLVVRGGKVARAAVEAATHGDELADAARAFTHAEEAADALRAAERVEETFRSTENAIEIAKRDTDISPQARIYLQALKREGQVVVSRGQMSARLLGEISAAAGAEVALVRLQTGERVLVMGQAHNVSLPSNTQRVIAHTHPSGILRLSEADTQTLSALGQRSSVLVDLLGQGRRVRIPTIR